VDLAGFSQLARARRTHMIVDPARPVEPALVDELCALATWAPNHKRTWPWRFAALTGDARAALGEAFVADMVAAGFGDEGKRAKTLTKYTRTPTILVVASVPDHNPQLHHENAYAVAAGVQNLLLGATAAGLASFWSTPPLPDSPSVLELCGFDPADRIIAVVYLGWPTGSAQVPDRPAPQVTHLS
jgi:nitroreductase